MKADHAELVGEAFEDTNARGFVRHWQRVRLSYPDGAVLHADIDLSWPWRELGQTLDGYALDMSAIYREWGWAT